MKKYIETINAVDESGNQYTLTVWQEFTENRTFSGTSWVPGLKTIYDQNKRRVNCVEDDFLVVQTQTKLKRINP